MLISESIKIANDLNLIKSSTIIVDATHTHSMYNSKSQRDILIDESRKLRKLSYEFCDDIKEKMPKKISSGIIEDHLDYCKKLIKTIKKQERLLDIPAVSEKLNYLQEIIDDNLENLRLSTDEDAKTGHKTADLNFFGYNEHLTIIDERLITAAVITSGEKHDGKQLQKLVEKSVAAGQEVTEIIGDGAYSESDNLLFANSNNISLISKLSKNVIEGNRHKGGVFEYNKDAMMYVCPKGHLSLRKSKTHITSAGRKYPTETYYFDVENEKDVQIEMVAIKMGQNQNLLQSL